MNISGMSFDSTPEGRLHAELIRLRDSLPTYLQSKTYRKDGFRAIEEWLIPFQEDASLLNKLLKETNVIPSLQLERNLVTKFYNRHDKWVLILCILTLLSLISILSLTMNC